MTQTIDWYKKSSNTLIAFALLALVTNLINVLFFSMDTISEDGTTNTTDYQPLIQSVFYLVLAGVGAYFIRRKSKVAAIMAGVFAMVVGLSTFWLQLFHDGENLLLAFETAQGFILNDQLVIMWLFYFIVSLVSIALCIMITGATFSAVFGKK